MTRRGLIIAMLFLFILPLALSAVPQAGGDAGDHARVQGQGQGQGDGQGQGQGEGRGRGMGMRRGGESGAGAEVQTKTGEGAGAGQGAGARGAGFFGFLARPKLIAMLVLGLLALVLLLTKAMRDAIKIPLLLISTFLFGIAANLPVAAFKSFAMHPSPICAATKSILYGFRMPMIALLAVILFLTLIGPKLFCGWVCPVGAVQELIAMLADKLKIKRIKWNFTFSQAVRYGIFLLFIFLSGTGIYHAVVNGKKSSLSLYDPINAFHGFEFGAQPSLWAGFLHYLPLLLTIVLAFKVYRPFCHLVCPIGLLTHWLEQVGLFRVTLKKSACTDCGICSAKTPCAAIPEILKESNLRPDCFACNACVQACRSCRSLEFGVKRSD